MTKMFLYFVSMAQFAAVEHTCSHKFCLKKRRTLISVRTTTDRVVGGMTMKLLAILSVTVAALGMTAPALAAPVVYTISGVGSGSLSGTAFNNAAFTFTLTGDTAALGNDLLDPLGSATASIAGFDIATFLIPTRIGVGLSSVVYFSRSSAIGGLDLFDFGIASPVNLAENFGPVSGGQVFALFQFQNVATTGGGLSFDAASGVQFSGRLVAQSVPEPATWAMMVLGLGGVGYTMRRRSSVTIGFHFA